jgi:uncharacterized protein (TIRG00374 family)
VSKPTNSGWKILLTVLKYLLAIGLLAYVITSYWNPSGGHGLAEVWQKHVVEGNPIAWHYLVLAFLICLASISLTFVRWYILVRAQDLPFTMTNAFRLGMLGFFLSMVLPGSVTGDVVKAAFLAREQSRRTVAVATVIMDRALALWALFSLVAMLGGFFWASGMLPPETERASLSLLWASVIVVGVSLGLWALLGLLPPARVERFAGRLTGIPKVGPALAELWRAMWMYRCRQWSVLVTLVMSWIGHVGFVLTFYFSALTLFPEANQIPTLQEHFLIVPYGLLIQAIPLFPGGAGIGELGFGQLYKVMGSSEASGVLGSLVQRVVMWGLALSGYLVYLWMGPAVRPAAAPPEAVPPLATAEAS